MRIPLCLLLLLAATAAEAFDVKVEAARCAGCHGEDGHAQPMPSSGRIAGQNEPYLFYILKQYKARQLFGADAAIMTFAVKHLSDDELRELARYYAGLP